MSQMQGVIQKSGGKIKLNELNSELSGRSDNFDTS